MTKIFSRRMVRLCVFAVVFGSVLLRAGADWQFNGSATPLGVTPKLQKGMPKFVEIEDGGQALAPGGELEFADHRELRLQPEIEIKCRFRLDKLRETVQNLVSKDGEYILRVDWAREGGHLSFFTKVNGSWESRVRGPVVETGVWYDVAAEWTGTEIKMTVNGEEYKTGRDGKIAQGEEPVIIGGIDGVIDHLSINNPALGKQQILKSLPTANLAAKRQTSFGLDQGWAGWKSFGGARFEERDKVLHMDFPNSEAMVISPLLDLEARQMPFISIEVKAPGGGWTGFVNFVTEAGTGSIPFKPTDGGFSLLSGTFSDSWHGKLRYLGLSFSGGKGTVELQNISLGDRALGRPQLYIRDFSAGRAKLRPGREETVIAGIMNVGGESENVAGLLEVPTGVEILGENKQAIPYLGNKDFDLLTWRLRVGKAGDYNIRLRASTPGGRVWNRDLVLHVEDLPELPRTGYVPEPRPAKTRYTSLMHYCALWKQGTHYGWEKIEPYPSVRPAIGWYDEGKPEVADWHIKYALEHGVNGFIYCWYRANYGPDVKHTLGHAIHEGLFHARYRDKFNFTIMWENGCAKGVKDADDLMDNLMPFWMKNYFTHPSYLKIDNQPVFFVWQPRRLIPQLGGPEGTRKTFERMRQFCRDAGFAGLRIIACMNGPEKKLGKDIEDSGWDAVSGYGITTHAKPVGIDPEGIRYRDHREVLSQYRETWEKRALSTGAVPDIPNVVMGWDTRPWGRAHRSSYIADPKAENFEAACRDAKELVDAKPADRWDRNLIVFDNWTEFGEGHYIEPTTGTGFSFLNAIKKVFCSEWAPEDVTDIIPEDVGLEPPQERYEAARKAFGKHLPWQPRRITGDLLARWTFDKKKDGAFIDSSTNGIDLPAGEMVTTSGRDGKVLVCDGAGGASLSASPAFFPVQGLTISLWCKPSREKQGDRWMVNTVGASQTGYRLGFDGGKPCWQVPKNSWSHGLSAPKPLLLDRWSHIAATFDNRIMRLYVDGEEVATLERRGFINPGKNITIGNFSRGMERAAFYGCLDDVRIYRQVLSADAIKKMAGE